MVLWIAGGMNAQYALSNGPAYLGQIILLASLIYYAAPRLLFEKKYVLFIGFSLVVILLFSWLSSQFYTPPDPRPEGLPGPPMGRPQPPLRPIPSRFFIHLLVLTITYILATVIETFLFAQQKEQETIRNRNEKLQTELQFLKFQINPHFLFNALNNIYALTAIDTDKTREGISNLSDMLRYVLYDCEQEKVAISKEVAYIENYIELFSLKSSRKFPITMEVHLDNHGLLIEPMLLIPFMENALKHGNIEKVEGAFLKIVLKASKTELVFEVVNSFTPRPKEKDTVGGIGIENVRRRLELLYPRRHELSIRENSDTFNVMLNLKLQAHD